MNRLSAKKAAVECFVCVDLAQHEMLSYWTKPNHAAEDSVGKMSWCPHSPLVEQNKICLTFQSKGEMPPDPFPI